MRNGRGLDTGDVGVGKDRRQLAGPARLAQRARRLGLRAGNARVRRRLRHRQVVGIGFGLDQDVGHRNDRDLVDQRQRLQSARLAGALEIRVGDRERLADEVVGAECREAVGAVRQRDLAVEWHVERTRDEGVARRLDADRLGRARQGRRRLVVARGIGVALGDERAAPQHGRPIDRLAQDGADPARMRADEVQVAVLRDDVVIDRAR